MPRASVATQSPAAPPPAPPAKRRGKSKKTPGDLLEGRQPAKGKILGAGIPPHPGAGCDLDDLNVWLSGVTPEGWKLIDGPYLYRRWPIINTRMVDPEAPKNIDIFTGGVIPEALIRSRHGGGAYKVIVSVKAAYGQQAVIVCNFKIPEDECPPKLDPHTLVVGSSKNGHYVRELKAAGVLDEEGNVRKTGEAAMQETVEKTMDKLVDKVIEGKGTMGPAEIRDAVRSASAESGTPWKEVFSIFREQMQARGGGDGGQMVSVVQLMMDQQNAGLSVLTTAMQSQANFFTSQLEFYRDQGANRPAPESSTEQLDKLLTLQDRLAARNGGGGGEGGWAEALAPALTELGKGLASLAGAYMASKNGGPMQPNEPAAAAADKTPAPAAAAPVTRPPPPPLPSGGYKNPIAPFIHNNHLLVLESLASNESGAVFCARAADLIARSGKDADSALASLTMAGEPLLADALKQVEFVWNHAGTSFTEQRAARWVSEFFAAAAARKK